MSPAEIEAVRRTFPNWDTHTIVRHLKQRDALIQQAPRFAQTYCSQCGRENGPGNSGVSRCADHSPWSKQ